MSNEIVFSKRFRNRLSDVSRITIILPPLREPVRWHISRQWVRAAILSLALFFLLLFASGCGLDEHAKKTESLEKRIAKMEEQSAALGELKAQSAAKVEAALAYFKDARRWLQKYIQWLQRQEMSE